MDQSRSSASLSESEGPNAGIDPTAPPPPAAPTDPNLNQFLAAQTQLMSTVMQNMNQMMAQQNQAAAALVSLVDQQNQTIATLMTMVNQNPQFAALPPPLPAISALEARSEEPSPKEIHPEALSVEAFCGQQDLRHKRRMTDQDQEAAGSSKARAKQPQPSKTPESAVSKSSKSSLCPPMRSSRDNLSGRPQQKKTPIAGTQCFGCR